MTKPELKDGLKKQYHHFVALINSLTYDQYNSWPEGKWNPGQHLSHLIRSVAPLNKVMQSRATIEGFGTADQPSRSYDELVAYYQGALASGGKAGGTFLPDYIELEERGTFTTKLLSKVDLLAQQLDEFPEEDLDKLVIPHPLLGNLTMREMMYFTIYHGQHHQFGVKKMMEA